MLAVLDWEGEIEKRATLVVTELALCETLAVLDWNLVNAPLLESDIERLLDDVNEVTWLAENSCVELCDIVEVWVVVRVPNCVGEADEVRLIDAVQDGDED